MTEGCTRGCRCDYFAGKDGCYPSEGVSGSSITWESNNEKILEKNGIIHRPAAGEGDANVTLTATVFGS